MLTIVMPNPQIKNVQVRGSRIATQEKWGTKFEKGEVLLTSHTHLGFKGLFANHYVALCAAFSALGGLIFGYEYVSTAFCLP